MKRILQLSVLTSALLYAGGYKIPVQSINSMALGAAYVAHTDGADTVYFNPANMAFMSDEQFIEAGITWVHSPRNKFDGVVAATSGESEIENAQLPFLHYVAKPIGDFRWGTSLTVPYGLTKRWNTPVQKASAEKFSLKVIELNPSASYKVSDNFALGGGLRLIHASGVVKSEAPASSFSLKRVIEGDTTEFGYNLAMTYKPTSDINMAITYRSNIDLDLEGNADISAVFAPSQSYAASVSVPLPAALNIAFSKTWNDKYTVELIYEKTYWSKYKDLDFNYDRALAHPALTANFDTAQPRNWKDTNTFRVGMTGKVSDSLTLMAGYTKDETPVNKQYLSYELADADANIYSIGFRIKQSEKFSYGVAYLYADKENITLAAGENTKGIIGQFSSSGVSLLTLGATYTF